MSVWRIKGQITALLALVLAGAALASPGPDGFAALARRLSPAVVNISTSQKVEGDLPLFPKGSPLERFNDTFGQGGPRTENSLGSGFVIDPKGIIVTNNHVIKDADEIDVTFPDGVTLTAEVVGRDAATDLAVLRVHPQSPLPSVRLGDSDTAQPGDWVLAIGNPFGLGGSLSAGIVSARNRDIQAGRYDDFIQTDAAINKGNSGGPLFNMAGEVIGVNSAILSPSGGSVGIGFAIPSNLVSHVVPQLLRDGHVSRGWLGVRVQSVSAQVAKTFGLDKPQGAIVLSVSDGSPAQAAGVETGDLIIAFDGHPIVNSRTLTRLVADSPAGKTVTLRYIRGQQAHDTRVTIARLADESGKEPAAKPQKSASTKGVPMLGMRLAPLSEALRRRYNLASDVTGLVVTDIEPGTDAAAKIHIGDVIAEIGWQKIASVEDAKARLTTLQKKPGVPVALLVNRHGQLLPRALRP